MQIATLFSKIFPYFFIYTEYINNYQKAVTLYKELKQSNSRYREFMSQFDDGEQLKNLSYDDLLILPVQRPSRYKLLFQDIMKNAKEGSEVYKSCQIALNQILDVNKKINELLQSNMSYQKLNELTHSIDNLQQIDLFEKDRQFIQEESINVFLEKKQTQALVVMFNDLLLVLKQKSKLIKEVSKKPHILLMRLILSESSYVKDVPDSKYYKYMFTIVGDNDSLTVMCVDQMMKTRLIKDITQVIQALKKSSQIKKIEQISVRVAGTEELVDCKSQKYTAYIVELFYEQWHQNLRIRYSQIRQIELQIIKKWKIKVKFPHFSNWNKLFRLKTIIIEQRKLIIEEFLQKLLSVELFTKFSKQQQLWIKCVLCLNDKFIQVIDNLYAANYQNIQFKLLQNDKQLCELDRMSDNGHLSQSVKSQEKGQDIVEQQAYESIIHVVQAQSVPLKVECMDRRVVEVTVTRESTAENICQQVAERIKLIYWEDFRLCIYDEQKNQRVLEKNELIFNTLFPQFDQDNLNRFAQDKAKPTLLNRFKSLFKTNKKSDLLEQKCKIMF